MKLIPILLISTFLHGCVGVTVGTFGKSESIVEGFSIRSDKGWSSGFNDRKYTKDEIINIWGAPNNVSTEGRCEVLNYNNGYIWSGVWAYLFVLPIPVGIPTENKTYSIYLKNGETIYLKAEHTEETYTLGYMCGELECGFLAGNVYPFTGLSKNQSNTTEAICN